MAVKEYIDDTYNRAMFSDSPPQPQTMDQGPSDNTGIMEGFEQTEEQQQGLIDQAQDLNGLVAATRGAEIPEEELRKEAQAIMAQSMGEDKAVAVAALISPDILVAMQPLIQSMYDETGINSLIETEDVATPQTQQGATPQIQQGATPQIQQGAELPMQPPQPVPGMAGGGIVKLQTGGLADLDPYAYLRERKEPDWEEQETALAKKYEDVGTAAMDKEQLQGIILMDVAKQILSLGARGEGTVVDKFIKGAQSTSDLVQQLSISQAKIKGTEKREAKVKAIERIEDLKTTFTEQRYKRQKERASLASDREDAWDRETNSPIKVSKWDMMNDPTRYIPKRKKGTVMKGTYNYAQDPNVIAEINKIPSQDLAVF